MVSFKVDEVNDMIEVKKESEDRVRQLEDKSAKLKTWGQ